MRNRPYPGIGKAFAVGAILSLGLVACRHEEPNFIYMPDMVYSPAIKAQKLGSMRPPVKGTIPRGFEPYRYATNPDLAGKELKNPLRPTREVLERGQAMFNTYCIACHGPQGDGDGPIAPKLGQRPPPLYSDKVSTWPDGRIYHVIMMGQNIMPSYASQIAAGDRWAIIHYLRVIQKSKRPTPDDIKAAQALSQ